ncbi:hypothetical protein HBI25_086690 [Parastagonospora nodorum]|nr:hypothetical protein HBI25_086690 [Parastagonospora nodorum]
MPTQHSTHIPTRITQHYSSVDTGSHAITLSKLPESRTRLIALVSDRRSDATCIELATIDVAMMAVFGVTGMRMGKTVSDGVA